MKPWSFSEKPAGEIRYESVGTFCLPKTSQLSANTVMNSTDATTNQTKTFSSRGRRRAQPGGGGVTDDSTFAAMSGPHRRQPADVPAQDLERRPDEVEHADQEGDHRPGGEVVQDRFG